MIDTPPAVTRDFMVGGSLLEDPPPPIPTLESGLDLTHIPAYFLLRQVLIR